MEYYLKAHEMYPNADCELIYHNAFELLIAVVLSAQTTDQAVNKVTNILFKKYPTVLSLANAKREDVIQIIKPLGLSKTKSNYLINIAKVIHEKYNDIPPNDYNAIESLSGVGRKTTNVFLSTIYNEPHIAVDTHVYRVSKRLGFIDENMDVILCEKALEKRYPKELWKSVHHTFLFLGRYTCLAKNPKCSECKLKDLCKFYKMKEA